MVRRVAIVVWRVVRFLRREGVEIGVELDVEGFRVAKLRVAFVEATGEGAGAEVVRLWCWTGRWDRDEGGAQREAWRFGPSMVGGLGVAFGRDSER